MGDTSANKQQRSRDEYKMHSASPNVLNITNVC